MNKTGNETQSKCALTDRYACGLNVFLRALEIITPAVFSLSLLLQNVLGWAGVRPGPSYFALGGICLYHTIVCCSDQGIW